LQVIASGGIRNGVEAAKAITLGANLIGIALPFLSAAEKSETKLTRCIHTLIYELKLAMFGIGARTLDELRRVELMKLS
jgi:isopentenyl-diphosphate delta-isomerase